MVIFKIFIFLLYILIRNLLDDDWSGISQDAKNLIKKMLTYNAKDRISALEALNDKWIQANSSQNQLNVKVLSNLSSFHVKMFIFLESITF